MYMHTPLHILGFHDEYEIIFSPQIWSTPISMIALKNYICTALHFAVVLHISYFKLLFLNELVHGPKPLKSYMYMYNPHGHYVLQHSQISDNTDMCIACSWTWRRWVKTDSSSVTSQHEVNSAMQAIPYSPWQYTLAFDTISIPL